MKQRLSAKGFSAIEALIVLLVVAALCVGGWFVWQKNNTSTPDTQTDGQPKQSDDKKNADPSEGGKYLVIKEWGVRFALAQELQGDLLSYLSDAESSGSVIFASKRLNQLTGDSSCELIKQPWGGYAGGIQASLARINPQTYKKDLLESYKSQLTFVKKLGEYEYYYTKPTKNPPITCLTGQHEDHSEIEQSITDQLRSSFKSIEFTN